MRDPLHRETAQDWAKEWGIMWNFHSPSKPTASESTERCSGLLKQKRGLLTNNLDRKAWTKAAWEVAGPVSHAYRQNETLLNPYCGHPQR